MGRSNAVVGFALTIVLVICAAAIVGRSAFAPPESQLRLVDASGALSISNDREGQAVLSAAGLVPGRSVSGRVTVDAGSAALTLSETPPLDTPGPGGGRLSDHLGLRVDDVTNPAAPRLVYSGALGALPALPLGAAAGGGARTYEFTVTFSQAGLTDANAYMASSASIGFAWDATAAGGPGPSAPYADQVAFDGPLAFWNLGAGPGPSDAGGAHDGAFANGVASGVPGVAGDHTAAWFDGASAYAYVNGLAAPRRAYTLEAWIRPDRTSDMTIVEQGGAGALLLRDGRPAFRQTDTEIAGPSALEPGTWHHLAGTWDGRTARLYLDGAEIASGAATKAPSGSATLYIGYGAAAPWFAGTIDGVAYYPTALPAARVAAHFGAVTVPAPTRAAPAQPAADPPPAPTPPATGPTPSAPAKVVAAGKPAEPKAKPKHRAKKKPVAHRRKHKRRPAPKRKH